MHPRLRFAIACTGSLFVGEPAPLGTAYAPPEVDESAVHAGAFPSLRVLEPDALVALERRGFSLGEALGANGGCASTEDLVARSPRWKSLVEVLDADLDELSARPGISPDVGAPNHPFNPEWLRSPRTHFELVAVVNRLDRKLAEPLPGCGEVRLVYRLALQPAGRPTTRLPMTVNVILAQPADAQEGCRGVAERWIGLPRSGLARVLGLANLVREASLRRVEVDLQNMHGPSLRRDEDDHAEYILRSFDPEGARLIPRGLLDTPRLDLDGEARAALREWVTANRARILAGTAVVPDRFLAVRAVSVTPRGMARAANRPFKALLTADGASSGSMALIRRLDELTCVGCHQSRSIAGFHVLGQERDPEARFNALATGSSPHFDEELPWRQTVLEHVAAGRAIESVAAARPFAERASPVGYGAHCALRTTDRTDAIFADWSCPPHFRCRDVHGDEIGTCVPDDANHAGDACQDAVLARRVGPDGDRVLPRAPEPCAATAGADPAQTTCSPNSYGFPGGACSDACQRIGEVQGESICADLPVSGFESDCFATMRPIEECLPKHLVRRRVRACDSTHPCRDDYACARVDGVPPDSGACVPPYFLLQARVDGPLLDR